MREKRSHASAEDDTGETVVTCPYCAGRGEVFEGRAGSFYEAPCSVCQRRGVVPARKRASYLRSLV
jgi:DnaJ-class molecular chaperone